MPKSQLDALSEILGGVAMKGALFFSAEFSAPWGFAAPRSRSLAPILTPGTPHLVIYHFLVEGSGVVRVEDGSQLQLEAGDIIVLPHGNAHRMSSAEGTRSRRGEKPDTPAYPYRTSMDNRSIGQRSGLSRSALVERFTRYLSEPPMTYLTRLQLQLAARALRATARGVLEIASDVGYESEASFNRAFKREFGLPPARYRREHRADGNHDSEAEQSHRPSALRIRAK
jgi:AraC-like DNA-binding protein